MKPERISDLINAVEAEVDVGAATFEDFEVWPVVRLMIGALGKEELRTTRRSPLRRLRTLPSVPTQVAHVVRPPRPPTGTPRAVFLNQRSSLQGPRDGMFHDAFGEPLEHLLAEEHLSLDVWDWADVDERRRPTHRPVTPVDAALGGALLLASLHSRSGRVPASLVGSVDELVAAVRRQGVELRTESAVSRVLAVDRIARVVTRLMGERPPVLGFVMCFYGLPGLGFTLACRRLGVMSVDVQHGVQGSGHLAYGRWSGHPGPRSALLPDMFWCWRDSDATWIDEAFGSGRAVVGGNLLLATGDDDVGLDRRPRAAREILVSLQPELALPDAVRDAIAEGPHDWRWWVRPHPTMTPSDALAMVPERGRSRVVVDEAAAAPLGALLRHVDVHVTGYSSVAIEAEALGVPSVLTDPVGGPWFLADQLASRHATLVGSAAELVRSIAEAVPLHEAGQPRRSHAVKRLLEAAAR